MGNQTPQSHFCESYGWHEIIKVDDKTLIEKIYKMNSTYQRESFQRLLRLMREIKCDTILNFGDVFQSNDDIIVQFEYLPFTLQQQIQMVKDQYLRFSEKDIINILDCVLSSLMIFSFKGLHHHSLKTINIFIRQNPKKYVITFPKLIDSQSKDKLSNKQPFLSPEQLNNDNLTQKSDVFSLGLIILSVCNLKPIDSIYTAQSINQFQIIKQLSNITENYSQQLSNLLRQMLKTDLNQRPNLNTTYEMLQTIIQNESMLRYQKSNSKRINERIESERQKQLEDNGIHSQLPTYCFITDKQFTDQLFGGRIDNYKQLLGESRRSNNSNKSTRSGIKSAVSNRLI